MKILLDTCTFLWLIQDSKELSETAKGLFSNAHNDIYLSVVSNWEILIKYQLGRLNLPKPTDKFISEKRKAHRIESLSLEENAIGHLLRLPYLHKDPFDRILICQAISNGLTILTSDSNIRQYPVSTAW